VWLTPSQAPRTEPELTIEVNIGRVDVRALSVPAPTQSRAAGRSKPALSLDDYLKERNRGGA
jgi:hypothetical protein